MLPSVTVTLSQFGSAARRPASCAGPLATRKKRPTAAATSRSSTESPTAMHSARVVAAGAGVAGDRRRLADLLGDQVVGVGAALDGRHRPPDRAVVEQPQVVVAALAQQRVGLLDVDLAAEEVGEDAAVVPGRVVLEPPFEVLEEQLRDPPLLDLLVDRAVLARRHLAGHQRRLALDREGAAGLVDVGGLAHQPRRLVHLRLAAAGHDHDLGAGPVAGLERRAPAPARSRPRGRGRASCPCRAGSRRGRCRRNSAPRGGLR